MDTHNPLGWAKSWHCLACGEDNAHSGKCCRSKKCSNMRSRRNTKSPPVSSSTVNSNRPSLRRTKSSGSMGRATNRSRGSNSSASTRRGDSASTQRSSVGSLPMRSRPRPAKAWAPVRDERKAPAQDPAPAGPTCEAPPIADLNNGHPMSSIALKGGTNRLWFERTGFVRGVCVFGADSILAVAFAL